MSYFQEETFNLFDEKLYITEAPETSDIIWENLPISTQERVRRKLKTVFILTIVMILITILFMKITHLKENYFKALPPTI